MGQRGAKLTPAATKATEKIVEQLSTLGDVSSRKMFGGYGVFESGVMFALVTSAGVPHLKVNDTNLAPFENAGAEKFGRMPYYEIPAKVLNNTSTLRKWARVSIALSQSDVRPPKRPC